MKQTNEIQQDTYSWKKWIKRIGVIGFMFFLIKGLIWILIFIGIGNWFN